MFDDESRQKQNMKYLFIFDYFYSDVYIISMVMKNHVVIQSFRRRTGVRYILKFVYEPEKIQYTTLSFARSHDVL